MDAGQIIKKRKEKKINRLIFLQVTMKDFHEIGERGEKQEN